MAEVVGDTADCSVGFICGNVEASVWTTCVSMKLAKLITKKLEQYLYKQFYIRV